MHSIIFFKLLITMLESELKSIYRQYSGLRHQRTDTHFPGLSVQTEERFLRDLNETELHLSFICYALRKVNLPQYPQFFPWQ